MCEDVTVAVAGKKNAVRGKVWRLPRNGDYLRYRCLDDGCEYRPGGKFWGRYPPPITPHSPLLSVAEATGAYRFVPIRGSIYPTLG